MPAVECCVQLIHSILCTVLWTKYLVTVSADAAGIILTSLVINRQLWLYHDSGDAGLTQLYRMRDAQLWRHIEFHPECNAIYAALD